MIYAGKTFCHVVTFLKLSKETKRICGVLQTPREMKIEDRQSQGGFQEVDPTFFFFPLLRTRMAFRSPFSATINALLPEASSSKRAEQPRRKA